MTIVENNMAGKAWFNTAGSNAVSRYKKQQINWLELGNRQGLNEHICCNPATLKYLKI